MLKVQWGKLLIQLVKSFTFKGLDTKQRTTKQRTYKTANTKQRNYKTVKNKTVTITKQRTLQKSELL